MAETDDIRYFPPPPPEVDSHDPEPEPERPPQPVGLVPLPDEVLIRHNARVLDPRTAPALPGYPPVPTIYRATDLIVPYGLKGNISKLSEVLKHRTGMVLGDATKENNPFFARAELRAGDDFKPVVVDAWVALQALRAAVDDPEPNPDPTLPKLTKDDIAGIGLNHVMIGAAMGGIGGASGVLHGVPGAVNGGPYAGGLTDDLGYWRRPVMLQIPRPPRRKDADIADEDKRRPVIAVLDTGTAANTWLDTVAPGTTKFVVVDPVLQKDIDDNSLPGEVPGGSEDLPSTTEPLIGELSTHSGHATFIAGLIQQIEPDATVLSIRVMHNDGIASSGTISYALRKLLKRVTDAQDNTQPDKMVDIVSLSLGNFIEGDFQTAQLTELTKAIDDLRERGVIVVASAGNYASSREFYPAALAKRPDGARPPVISVGALNPNRTKTLFSNDSATWVTCWARGASLISTYPETTNAARNPALRVLNRMSPTTVPNEKDPINFRESMESDDYVAGFAMWSGTSFATPLVVGKLANLLFNGFDDSVKKDETIARAIKVIQKLGGEK